MIKLPLDVLSFELQKSKLTDKISKGKCEYRDRLWNIWPVFFARSSEVLKVQFAGYVVNNSADAVGVAGGRRVVQ